MTEEPQDDYERQREINRKALIAIIEEGGIGRETAEHILRAIIRGKVPGVSMSYAEAK